MPLRAPFFVRFAIFAAFMVLCVIVGFTTLVSFAVSRPWLVAMAVMVAAIAMIGVLTTFRRVGRPLDAVMDAADRVAEGDYSVRVPERGAPSVRGLARSFNTMTTRLQSHDRLRRDLMADLAHELRTPLAVIQGKLEGLLDGVYQPDQRQLQQLLEETHVLSRLVDDLRTLALAESGALKLQKESIDMGALAQDVVGAFEAEATSRQVAVRVDAHGRLPVIDADPVRLREVIANLLSNAIRHTPPSGSVVVDVAAQNGHVAVNVRDTGSGMTAAEVAHVFDRFYKGRESRGAGLGLTIAKNLVTAHGGEIHASSEPGRGTTLTFTLPV